MSEDRGYVPTHVDSTPTYPSASYGLFDYHATTEMLKSRFEIRNMSAVRGVQRKTHGLPDIWLMV